MSPSDILTTLKKDLPGAIVVCPLRSGDIRVVFKDTKTKDWAIAAVLENGQGIAILRQEFPLEVMAVPLAYV